MDTYTLQLEIESQKNNVRDVPNFFTWTHTSNIILLYINHNISSPLLKKKLWKILYRELIEIKPKKSHWIGYLNPKYIAHLKIPFAR